MNKASKRFPAVVLFVLMLGVIFASSSPAMDKMVAINRPEVNMRSGPGTNYKILWVLKRGYPLQVVDRKNKWYRVRDFEGDTGWVYASLTNREAHFVVKKEKVNLRSGPGTHYRIVAQAKRGVVFRTVKRVKGWVKVKHENGITAWVARQLVWGW